MKLNKFILTAASAISAFAALAADFKPADVLIYTRWDYVKNPKTGEVKKGGFDKKTKPFYHASTDQGAEEVRRYFTANGLSCLVTDKPEVFTSSIMKSLKLIMLCSTNHELFDTKEQREAFYKFVENGGGLLATHSASANERGDKRFRDFLGGAFERHYAINQKVPFKNVDRSHPAMACMEPNYVWEKDEIYLNHPDESVRPILILNWEDVHPKSRKGDKYGKPKIGGHVLEWCRTYGKGRIFYTALGHNPADWGKMEFQLHLLEAARWAMGMRPDKVNAKTSGYKVQKTIDGVECLHNGKTLWKFNIANRESKPFIHPLCLPDGRCITDARPKDHPWHLGLWFCWKYINGVNYWEPRDPSMSNLFPDGMTVVKDFSINPKGGACTATLDLWYGPRATPGKVLLEEKRTINFSEPDASGRYTIRSTHVFTAKDTITIDCRRPVGYGGFSCRMKPFMRKFQMRGTGAQPSLRKNIGGPKELTAVRYTEQKTGHGIEFKMLAPLPTERIYTWSDHLFANPMPIYEKPLNLKKGDTFTLDYLVSIY
jgi:type 1 glutamine amidotransferase